MSITGGCHCGGVRYEIDGPIQRFANCHCPDCRKITGSTYGSALALHPQHFRLTAGQDLLTAYESSKGKFRNFCRRCGSHVFARMDYKPDLLIVRAGSLDGDPGLRPQMHIWVSAKAPWHEIADSLPQYPEGYVPPPKTSS